MTWKKFRLWTGFKPTTFALPVQCPQLSYQSHMLGFGPLCSVDGIQCRAKLNSVSHNTWNGLNTNLLIIVIIIIFFLLVTLFLLKHFARSLQSLHYLQCLYNNTRVFTLLTKRCTTNESQHYLYTLLIQISSQTLLGTKLCSYRKLLWVSF